MYVRWKSRASTSSKHKDGELLIAHLVESVWVEGKSVKREIAYLGSIRRALLHDSDALLTFWVGAMEAATKAGYGHDNDDGETWGKIVKMLMKKVPGPQEAVRAYQEAQDYLLAHPFDVGMIPMEVMAVRSVFRVVAIVKELEKGQKVRVTLPDGRIVKIVPRTDAQKATDAKAWEIIKDMSEEERAQFMERLRVSLPSSRKI